MRVALLSAVVLLGLAGCTNPYDPGQRFVGGGLLGAAGGAAIGAAAGGGHGAALGAAIGYMISGWPGLVLCAIACAATAAVVYFSANRMVLKRHRSYL